MFRRSIRVAVLLAGPAALAIPASAQSNIDPARKHAWQENCGWLNWRDAGAPIGAHGVVVHATFLSGHVWCENIGWINLGDGTPTNGVSYANPNAGPVAGVPDFGVNRDAGTGHLSGFGWSENAGWINFSGGALAIPAQPARIDTAAQRFRGYAWGENIGWINLDDAAHTVGIASCSADFNGVDGATVQDIYDFLAAWNANLPAADFNGADGVTVQDIYDFLAAWNAGCV